MTNPRFHAFLLALSSNWPTFDEIEELAEEIALEPLNLPALDQLDYT